MRFCRCGIHGPRGVVGPVDAGGLAPGSFPALRVGALRCCDLGAHLQGVRVMPEDGAGGTDGHNLAVPEVVGGGVAVVFGDEGAVLALFCHSQVADGEAGVPVELVREVDGVPALEGAALAGDPGGFECCGDYLVGFLPVAVAG